MIDRVMKFVLKVICTLKKNNENILHDMPPMLHYWFSKSVQFGNYWNRSVIYWTKTETEITDRSVSVQ